MSKPNEKPLETQAERVFRERIEALEATTAELRRRFDSLETASGLYASEREMSGPYADPKVKFPLRDWRGQDFVGKTFSQCSPEYLDALAENLAYKSANPKEGKEKYAKLDGADSRRARTWARRLRAGWKPADAAAAGEFPGDAPAGFAAPAFEAPKFEAPAFEAPKFDDDDQIPF